MSLKEQKLFFTRNGQYTVWEKLNSLNLESFDEIYYYLIQKNIHSPEGYPHLKAFPHHLYKIYENLSDSSNDKETFELKVNQLFNGIENPKCDFNALIYYINTTVFDIQSIILNLEQLKHNLESLDIEGLEMDIWSDESERIVDIRFTSEKKLYFKENNNIQYLNTEIRIYVDLKVMLLTNFSQYTHSDNEKNKFILKVVEKISSLRTELFKPIKLSDHTLRKLIVMEDQNFPAKLKFHIEGRFKVGIDIDHSTSASDLISQEEIKYFYDKYPLSLIRVKINDDDEKLINLDGLNGKIFSRSLNLTSEDINEFVEKISILLEYDYLNINYKKDILSMASRRITVPNQTRENLVSTIYKAIEGYIQHNINDHTGVFVKLISNTFFYCLKEKIVFSGQFTQPHEIKGILDERILGYTKSISGLAKDDINGILFCLFNLYKQNVDNLTNLTLSIHKSIQDTLELMRDASGQ
ncbi:hypothetical protein L2089_01965 [Paenibacillus hunanensis]|uniref:hypothetical protein n=1 Tax=Paenibacillus hunanensis TaxID=539262 RepID=UPI0020275A86|nr:hypothetical protein [Paenibacillus hunanensis]MCL9659430.1 hypothetical protein [Paenibacillus hunanensis]